MEKLVICNVCGTWLGIVKKNASGDFLVEPCPKCLKAERETSLSEAKDLIDLTIKKTLSLTTNSQTKRYSRFSY